MYGVIVQMRIDRGHDDEVRAMVEAEVMPRAWQLPGFAGGSWFKALDGDAGTAVMFFDSEETAHGFAERVTSRGPLVQARLWSVKGAGTYEVLARA